MSIVGTMQDGEIGYWFERLLPAAGLRLTAVVVLAWILMVAMFTTLFGALGASLTVRSWSAVGTSLFFASATLYVIVAGALVLRRCATLLSELPLACDADTRAALQSGALTQPQIAAWINLAVGITGGTVHNTLLWGLNVVDAWTTAAVLGTYLAWIAISAVVGALVMRAVRFAQIARSQLEIDIYQPQRLYPMGHVALLPALGLLGSQTLYPLMWIGGEVNLVANLPGSVITGTAMVFLFFWPVWPVHQRLRAAKEAEFLALSARLDQLDRSSQAVEFNALLTQREHVENTSEWPFRLGTLAKWLLYLLIPPLTWVGAALIEQVVDGAL